MSYKINLGDFSSIFPMPTSIVDKHIRMASEIAIKTLLIILRNMENPPSPQIISQILGTDYLEEIEDAISYWEKAGIISEGNTAHVSAVEQTSQKTVIPVIASVEKTVPSPKEESVSRITKLSARAELSREETMAIINKNQELKHLVHAIQDITGKTLTSIDLDCLTALYTYYGMSADYILMVVHYCYTNGKASMRYVEKTACTWLDDGIDTHEKADIHISRLNSLSSIEGTVKSALGISDRALVSKERKYIENWYTTYGFDISMIRLAYERTVEGIGKLSFPYMDRILENWKKCGVKNPKEAADEAIGRRTNQNISTQDKPSYNNAELDKIIYRDYLKD